MCHFKPLSIAIVLIIVLVSACAQTNTPLSDAGDQSNGNIALPNPEMGTEASAETDLANDITGKTWLWERFDDSSDANNIVVQDPNAYTLILNVDGTYGAQADCNRASGGYTLAGSSLKLQPGPTTLAECGPESLYQTYLIQLENVATYVMDGDRLVLNLWADGGNMVFAPGQ